MTSVFVVAPLSTGLFSASGSSASPCSRPHLIMGSILQSAQTEAQNSLEREASLSGTQSQVSSATLLPAATGLAEQPPVDIGGGVCNQRILECLLWQEQKHGENTA